MTTPGCALCIVADVLVETGSWGAGPLATFLDGRPVSSGDVEAELVVAAFTGRLYVFGFDAAGLMTLAHGCSVADPS